MSGPVEYDDWDDGECWQCAGEGFVYGCSWDWQCDTWDGDSCLCTSPCDICRPPKPDPVMQQILADALAACPTCAGGGVLYRQDSGAHGLTVVCPECPTATGDSQ